MATYEELQSLKDPMSYKEAILEIQEIIDDAGSIWVDTTSVVEALTMATVALHKVWMAEDYGEELTDDTGND